MSQTVKNLRDWFDKLLDAQKEEVVEFLYGHLRETTKAAGSTGGRTGSIKKAVRVQDVPRSGAGGHGGLPDLQPAVPNASRRLRGFRPVSGFRDVSYGNIGPTVGDQGERNVRHSEIHSSRKTSSMATRPRMGFARVEKLSAKCVRN